PWIAGFKLPADLSISGIQILDIKIPSELPTIEEAGAYTFAFGAFVPNSSEFLSNLSIIYFHVK
ncbi:hypothetical protein KKB18_09600, partial [bacterium]|nr:hypothetical protein [bacterium]